MKRSVLLSAALLPILNAACVSLPGRAIVPPPGPAAQVAALPPPTACLADPAEPAAQTPPTLPPELPQPNDPPQATLAWLTANGAYWARRAQRSEVLAGFAANIAEEERRTRQENAANQSDCKNQLAARDAAR